MGLYCSHRLRLKDYAHDIVFYGLHYKPDCIHYPPAWHGIAAVVNAVGSNWN